MGHAGSLPPGWVDIHCHILPELDDGPPNWDQALAMARLAVREGTAWIVATPHQRGRYQQNTPAVIASRCEELRRRLREAAIPLEIFTGADVRIDEGLVESVKRGEVSMVGTGRYVLLELPHDIYLPLDSLLRELKRVGVTGILTHPERNTALLRHPEKLEEVLSAGALLQLTAGSLTGAFGPAVRQFAEELLLTGRVHVVASDGHGVRGRPPTMGEATRHIARRLGRDAADILCRRNPARIVQGMPVQSLERVEAAEPFWRRAWRRLAG
ncbi:MAG: CpsB/CapC family capsule biosynthesis tyrosine phosphatase [Thermogutta sp.]